MKNLDILIVDDNKSILRTIELLLHGRSRRIKTLNSPNLILSELRENSYQVVLLDMNFTAGINSGNEGLYWLEQILNFDKNLSVVMFTAYGDVELAVKAVLQGASDFILKPWENQKLLSTINAAYNLYVSKKEVNTLKQKEKVLIGEINKKGKNIIGSSQAMKSLMEMITKVSKTDANVLITGENGTGKELVAQEIHRQSNRSNNVIVSVDMGAISETLFESELFGHKKGAFTDAKADRIGKIETANKGSLFLDELGNLPLSMQSKLLTVLQNRELTKLGDNKVTNVDIRLISATNCKLDEMIETGKFREDLLYRINTIQIEVPPLRERGSDVTELAEFYLQHYAKKYSKNIGNLSSKAIDKLLNYEWPGNVRELQHTIEKAVILSDGETLTSKDFNLRNNTSENVLAYDITIEQMEKKLIKKALSKSEGNYSLAASNLGISRQTLYNKIKKYGL